MNLFSKIFGKKKQQQVAQPLIPHLADPQDIVTNISSLRGQGRYTEAVKLFEDSSELLTGTDAELVALTTIIKAADESSDDVNIIKYAKRLKQLEPGHPYVAQISKKHKF
ncbi:hypothetical protein AAEO56_06945 [Flavobacterium sp. DGU11]|uniref:Tetratricopeptide repeat protein n=1 Tax=Flavobacterium arundinis TaxID=3139143 RepID=A0ABU9HV08_9FLAO